MSVISRPDANVVLIHSESTHPSKMISVIYTYKDKQIDRYIDWVHTKTVVHKHSNRIISVTIDRLSDG